MLSGADSLGCYILVLANAAYDRCIWQQMESRLEERHYHLAAIITAALRQGRLLREPEDDLMVFLKLMAMGFGAGGLVESRQAGPWEVEFNPLRALRPPRASHIRTRGITAHFNPGGFHFNLPFLQKEVLWSGDLLGRSVRLLYNKFPFAELHGLLAPEPEAGLPQLLTPDTHRWAWALATTLCERLPGFGLAYNSYGAHASVNHLHFQSFMRSNPLPLADARWAHNGGKTTYPARCQAFDDPHAAWAAISRLHEQAVPYNLVYLPGRLFLLPRKPQGSHATAPWSSGHAWYEMAGGVITCNRSDFESMDEAAIEDELRQVSQA